MDNSTSSQKIKKLLLIAAQLVLSLLAVYLAIWQIRQYTDDIHISFGYAEMVLLLFAALLYGLFYVVLSFHWQYACKLITNKSSSGQWIAFWASQPYKYLPSSIFTFTFRAKFSKELGIGYKASSSAQLVENFSMLASAISLAVSALLVAYGEILMAIIAMAASVVIFMAVFAFANRVGFAHTIGAPDLLKLLGLSFFGWIIAGLGFALTIVATSGEYQNILSAIGANSFAFSASLIAVFAPGGVGIREYVYGLFGISATAIIAWRIITAVFDVIAGVFGWVMLRRHR